MTKSFTFLKFGFIGLALASCFMTQAQKKPGHIPPSIDDNEEIPVAITELPVPNEGKDYVVQYFKGITDGVESRIAVKNLGYIIRPAMVQVISEDGRELAIELVKKNWDDVVRNGKTIEGKFESSFKTAMEFGIKISAQEKGIPFVVAVSAGIELFPSSNLFVDASTMRPSAASVEVDLVKDESGESNNLLYIIMAVALVGILVLLAILVFKKKGKGTASMILFLLFSISADAGLVRSLGNSPHGKATAGLANFLIDSMGKRYARGDFSGDNPLGEDDKGHEPTLDPRGQPSLPSSCYEIARMGRSGSSGGTAGKGFSGAKNPTNEDGGISQTMSTGGGTIGGMSGSEAGSDIDSEDFDYEAERTKIYNEYAIEMAKVREVFVTGMTKAADYYSTGSQKALEEFNRKFAEDPDNAERALELQTELEQKNTRLAREYEERSIPLENEQQMGYRLAEQKKDDRLAALKARRTDQGGQSSRENNEQPDEGEQQSEGTDPPVESGGSPNSGGGRDQKKEAGCKCLEQAYANLQKHRFSLEKLLKIGQHTKKVTDFGISFGDDFSGVHGVSGLVWQTKRAEILKSIDKFDVTYTNKYNELIDRLYDSLIQIDECELKLGYENWYSQSGFIYYEFMKVRYASYK
ncbi:hypothetical protein ACOCEA_17315 [Maribacter sp. CXY002]|uniref:hypothetical protein n=1 Tax=Maribacter luteocoastalis TaxID=3407671 RepID=UPI003B6787A4